MLIPTAFPQADFFQVAAHRIKASLLAAALCASVLENAPGKRRQACSTQWRRVHTPWASEGSACWLGELPIASAGGAHVG